MVSLVQCSSGTLLKDRNLSLHIFDLIIISRFIGIILKLKKIENSVPSDGFSGQAARVPLTLVPSLSEAKTRVFLIPNRRENYVTPGFFKFSFWGFNHKLSSDKHFFLSCGSQFCSETGCVPTLVLI